MFLTRKDIILIRLVSSSYFILAASSLISAYTSFKAGESFVLYIVFAVLWLFPGTLHPYTGRYNRGCAKYVNMGNKLVNKELRPADFIKAIDEKIEDRSTIVLKPHPRVLALLIAAHNLLGDNESALKYAERIATAKTKQQIISAKLLKASVLYASGKTDVAENLFHEIESINPRGIIKTNFNELRCIDRAMVSEDYALAEDYIRKKLAKPSLIPNSMILIYHWNLYCICVKTDRENEAAIHLKYCAEHGGETAIKQKAKEMLDKLQS